MSIITSIILVAVIVVGVSFLAYYMQRGTKAMSDFKMDFDNNAEVQELVELSKELYNKDLRPVAPKTTKNKKSEFPIDKPAKKDKPVQQVEAIAEVVTPQVTEKVVEVADTTPVQVEPVVQVAPPTVEPVVEAPKPVRKKRKYYPKKK
jgi:preprotein translocase subunit SecF